MTKAKEKIRWMEIAAGLLMLIAATCWLIGYVDRIVMPFIVMKGVEIVVPDLRHLSITSADSICRAKKLELIRGRTRIDDRLPPGYILDQSPMAGVPVKPGRRIEVMINVTSDPILCPDLIKLGMDIALLKADSLDLATITRYSHSTMFTDGTVMAQRPEPMASMMKGDTIQLTISLGREPDIIRAPNLIGEHINKIDLLLMRHNVHLGNVTYFPDRNAVPNTIIDQDPPYETRMFSPYTIDVVVAATPRSSERSESADTTESPERNE